MFFVFEKQKVKVEILKFVIKERAYKIADPHEIVLDFQTSKFCYIHFFTRNVLGRQSGLSTKWQVNEYDLTSLAKTYDLFFLTVINYTLNFIQLLRHI